MAAAVSVPPLLPRPSPRSLAAWNPPSRHLMDVKIDRKTVKQLQQQSTTPLNRSRRERPCDGCRRRKSKCVIQDSGRCVLCEFHKQSCTFVENAQPRKRKAEDTSPKADGPSSNSRRSPPVSRRPQQPVAVLAQPPPPQPALPSRVPSVHPQTAEPTAKRLPMVDESLSLQSHRHCKYIGQTTALDGALVALSVFDDRNETHSSMGSLRQVTGREYFSTHADADVYVPEDEARALTEIEHIVHPHGPALINIYFQQVHPSYPIIQQQAFLDRISHGDRQFNPPLLAAMYLLALNWWKHDPSLSMLPMPDVSRLEYIASTSLSITMERPKISAVQAGLLLLQRGQASTWSMTVQLVALGQEIGLHLDCSDWSIPHWEKGLRKRLAWALYIQDKWGAVMHGRPSHINANDWNVPTLTSQDFDEPTAALPTPSEDINTPMAIGRTCFIQMISLTAIMAEICESFYSEAAKAEHAKAGANAPQLVLNRAKPVQIKLKDWFTKLPAECKMEHGTNDYGSAGSETSAQGHLHLAYFATEISIHRRIVQALEAAPPIPYMLFICRSAAKTRLISALDFVNRLRPEHLQGFWYFASPFHFALIGTFGALLQATSPGKEEADFYACRLNEYRWTLTMSAKTAPWIVGALQMLAANAQLLQALPEKPSAADSKPMRLPPSLPPVIIQQQQGGFAGGRPEEGEEFDEDDDEEGMSLEDWNEEGSKSSIST